MDRDTLTTARREPGNGKKPLARNRHGELAKHTNEFIQSLGHLLGTLAESREQQWEEALRTVENFDERLVALQGTCERLGVHLVRLGGAQENQEESIGRLISQSESLARKLEELSGDFIERHVTAPLCRELARAYGRLDVLAREPREDIYGEIGTLAEDLRLVLERHGLKPIHASNGETFDPRRHRPIEKLTTDNLDLDGKVVRTHHSGLSRNGTTIEAAKVSVYVFEEQTASLAAEGSVKS